MVFSEIRIFLCICANLSIFIMALVLPLVKEAQDFGRDISYISPILRSRKIQPVNVTDESKVVSTMILVESSPSFPIFVAMT